MQEHRARQPRLYRPAPMPSGNCTGGSACGAAEHRVPTGPGASLFAFWLSIMAGGPLRARPRPPLRSGPKGSQNSFEARCARAKNFAPGPLHSTALMPAQIFSARRQKERAATAHSPHR
mgnify:CR=1 FL=1